MNNNCCHNNVDLPNANGLKIEKILRGMAGAVVLISLLLYYFHSPMWLWLTVFAGINLLQSAFTNWCPAKQILEKLYRC